MDQQLHQLSNTLKAHKQSLTKPRTIVFTILSTNEAMTMADLVTACSGSLDRASVYRTVKIFEALGIVQRLQMGWKYKIELSNSFQAHHHHMTCLRCGRTIVLSEDEAIERQLYEMARRHGFTPTDHQLEIRGYCDRCTIADSVA